MAFAVVFMGVRAFAAEPQPQQMVTDVATQQELTIKVALVGSDLAVKPVPKRPFEIRRAEDSAVVVVITTSFNGEAKARLAPGKYRIVSKSSVDFEGKSFDWDLQFELSPTSANIVELSNDNAVASAAAMPVSTPALTEGMLYSKYRSGVFKIYASAGTGSGFLVDHRGLIITNYHVVRDTDYLAVKVSEREKFPAVVLERTRRRM